MRAPSKPLARMIVLEVVDYEISREITEMLSIPTIGIGAGPHLRFRSAQCSTISLAVIPTSPSSRKRYAEIGELATQALESYAQEVRETTFLP